MKNKQTDLKMGKGPTFSSVCFFKGILPSGRRQHGP
jgi:hypothetical protein